MSESEKTSNGRIPKPAQMKGMHYKQTQMHIIKVVGLISVTMTAVYFLRNQQRKKAYAEFYA